MALPCCPDGYIYVDSSGVYIDPTYGATTVVNNSGSTPTLDQVKNHCAQFVNRGFAQNPVNTIACSCCPANYGIVSVDGYVVIATGAIVFVGVDKAGLCVNLANFSQTADGSTCPCCPEGYVYFSIVNKCRLIAKTSGVDVLVPTIPCLPCTCNTITPPSCPSCGSLGIHISFSLDPTIKNCTDCIPEDNLETKNCRLNRFLATTLIIPSINFKLK